MLPTARAHSRLCQTCNHPSRTWHVTPLPGGSQIDAISIVAGALAGGVAGSQIQPDTSKMGDLTSRAEASEAKARRLEARHEGNEAAILALVKKGTELQDGLRSELEAATSALNATQTELATVAASNSANEEAILSLVAKGTALQEGLKAKLVDKYGKAKGTAAAMSVTGGGGAGGAAAGGAVAGLAIGYVLATSGGVGV